MHARGNCTCTIWQRFAQYKITDIIVSKLLTFWALCITGLCSGKLRISACRDMGLKCLTFSCLRFNSGLFSLSHTRQFFFWHSTWRRDLTSMHCLLTCWNISLTVCQMIQNLRGAHPAPLLGNPYPHAQHGPAGWPAQWGGQPTRHPSWPPYLPSPMSGVLEATFMTGKLTR